MLRRRAATALSLVALLAAGCAGGGSKDEDPAADAATETEQAAPAPAPPTPQLPLPGGGSPSGPDLTDPRDPDNPYSVPRSVPVTASKPATAAQSAVVERWSAAVTRADWDAAAATFADGARVRNLNDTVLRLPGLKERRAWNERSFSCGSEITDARDARRGYLIVTFRLTDRRGSPCGAVRGAAAQIVVRVASGKLTEWYRLPDPPSRDVPGAPSGEV